MAGYNVADESSLSSEQLDSKYNPDGDGEHPVWTRRDWRCEVNSENTLLGYWDWVKHSIFGEYIDPTRPKLHGDE